MFLKSAPCIPREKAVEGLKGELSALAKAQKPLQEMVEKLQTTVQASMHITQGNNDTEVLTKANEVKFMTQPSVEQAKGSELYV